MNELVNNIEKNIFFITFNRLKKHNAFDDKILSHLSKLIDEANSSPNIKVIVLRANGKHFSAGADLSWMHKMATFSKDENYQDAMVLAEVMYKLHHSRKPTIAMIQGAAYGGGAGIAAACNIAIASSTARFCFSEVKLGLIPAVISPYVVKAMGERAAKALFMSGEVFSAKRAYELGLVQHTVDENELLDVTLIHAVQLSQNAPQALYDVKSLVNEVAGQDIDQKLIQRTAELIAEKRVSQEGQKGLSAFLNKETPNWD